MYRQVFHIESTSLGPSAAQLLEARFGYHSNDSHPTKRGAKGSHDKAHAAGGETHFLQELLSKRPEQYDADSDPFLAAFRARKAEFARELKQRQQKAEEEARKRKHKEELERKRVQEMHRRDLEALAACRQEGKQQIREMESRPGRSPSALSSSQDHDDKAPPVQHTHVTKAHPQEFHHANRSRQRVNVRRKNPAGHQDSAPPPATTPPLRFLAASPNEAQLVDVAAGVPSVVDAADMQDNLIQTFEVSPSPGARNFRRGRAAARDVQTKKGDDQDDFTAKSHTSPQLAPQPQTLPTAFLPDAKVHRGSVDDAATKTVVIKSQAPLVTHLPPIRPHMPPIYTIPERRRRTSSEKPALLQASSTVDVGVIETLSAAHPVPDSHHVALRRISGDAEAAAPSFVPHPPAHQAHPALPMLNTTWNSTRTSLAGGTLGTQGRHRVNVQLVEMIEDRQKLEVEARKRARELFMKLSKKPL